MAMVLTLAQKMLVGPQISTWVRVGAGSLIICVNIFFNCHLIAVDSSENPESDKNNKRLNVVFILVDDLRPALGCYNDAQARSRAIDSLAARGMNFKRTYSQVSYSTTSRISILTGIRPDYTSLQEKVPSKSGLFPDAVSLPALFKASGYQTIGMGRIYMNATDDKESWSSPVWIPSGKWGGRGYFNPETIAALAASDDKSGRGPAYEVGIYPDVHYPDQLVAAHAIEELQRLQSQPFFMTIGFTAPHLPYSVPKKYWDMHEHTALKNAALWPTGMPDIAGHSSAELRQYTGIPKSGPLDRELARTLVRGYYASVSYIDEQIGRVLTEIDRLALTQNTIIVLCSDHGYKIGDYGAWTKFTSHEIDLHTPLIMMGPGIPANTATNSLTELVDIVPTLATMCGLQIPKTSEGLSLTPLFSDSGSTWKRAAFSLTPRGAMIGYSMRTDRWRYTEWITGNLYDGSYQVMSRELYDHQTSSIVSQNLADLPENRDLVKHLAQQLRCGWKHVRPSKGK